VKKLKEKKASKDKVTKGDKEKKDKKPKKEKREKKERKQKSLDAIVQDRTAVADDGVDAFSEVEISGRLDPGAFIPDTDISSLNRLESKLSRRSRSRTRWRAATSRPTVSLPRIDKGLSRQTAETSQHLC